MKIPLFLALVWFSASAQAQSIPVVPLPEGVKPGVGRLLIQPAFTVALSGAEDGRLERGARRFLGDLSRKTGFPLTAAPVQGWPATLIVKIDRAAKAVQDESEDESYALEVSSIAARLSAATTLGALHGLETFLQLVQIGPDGFGAPVVAIADRPRFAWRGLLIDVGRHFMPVDAIERSLDAMAAVKMNVLHWHLSEYQGFRVESKRFPKLHELGSGGQYYAQDQIREVVAYARDRGIRVVPEFDMPGHSQAWFAGYPELAAGPGPYVVEKRFGIFDPAMDPTRESTYRFLDKFVGEMASLFPDRYFHIGGDEVNGKQWDANPDVQRFMKEHHLKDNGELQHHFDLRVRKILAAHGKTMAGWEEILGPGLPKDTVVQAWRSQDTLAAAVKQGYRGLLSYGYYLDYMWPASRHYLIEPLTGAAATLTPEEQARILGGEACEWTEGVTPDDVDSRIWPRAAAAAERFWSPPSATDVPAFYARLERLGDRLELSGLRQRSGPDAMLRRLLGPGDIAPLAVLARAVVPVDEETREEAATAAGAELTADTPLNAFADAVPPESDPARRFAVEVDALLAGDGDAEAVVRAQLAAWKDNDAKLETALARSFLLKGLSSVSRNLAFVGETGLGALGYLDTHKAAPEDWEADRMAKLDEASKPQADVRLAVVDTVKKLVEASRAISGSPR